MSPIRLLIPFSAFIISAVIQAQDYPIEIVVQTGHYAEVTSVAFSADGKFAATGSSDKTVKLWETATGKEIRSYLGHTHDVRYIAFGPLSKHLASIDRDYHLKIWDIPSSKELQDFYFQ